MAVKDRRSGGRNWVPGLFAAFWILLAVFSAAYLFRIVTEPRSQTAELCRRQSRDIRDLTRIRYPAALAFIAVGRPGSMP